MIRSRLRFVRIGRGESPITSLCAVHELSVTVGYLYFREKNETSALLPEGRIFLPLEYQRESSGQKSFFSTNVTPLQTFDRMDVL